MLSILIAKILAIIHAGGYFKTNASVASVDPVKIGIRTERLCFLFLTFAKNGVGFYQGTFCFKSNC